MTSFTCNVCPRSCKLEEGKTGFCGVRTNINGENKDSLSGLCHVSLNPYVDIEGPTCRVEVALPGCNLQCGFCSVRSFSAFRRESESSLGLETLSACELAEFASALGARHLRLPVAEPALHHEYVLELAHHLQRKSIATVVLTNGFISDWLAEALGKNFSVVFVGVKGSGSKDLYARMGVDPSAIFRATATLRRPSRLWILWMFRSGLPTGIMKPLPLGFDRTWVSTRSSVSYFYTNR